MKPLKYLTWGEKAEIISWVAIILVIVFNLIIYFQQDPVDLYICDLENKVMQKHANNGTLTPGIYTNSCGDTSIVIGNSLDLYMIEVCEDTVIYEIVK